MTEPSYNPGDVVIDNLQLYSSRGNYDLSGALVKLVVYESIFTPNVVAEVTVIDSLNIIRQLQLIGDEGLNITFHVPGLPTVNYTLAVESISQEDFVGSEKTKQLTFHLVGRETLADKSVYIQKSYNTEISSIISDIHSTFLGSFSPLDVEATQGQQKIIIPSYKPFEAMDMVRQRATSASNPSSTYVYFENADGHHFKTIEGMMSQGTVKSFYHSDALPTSIFNNTLNNIINYEVPKFFSSVNRIDLGGLSQRTSTYDIRTRKYDIKDKTTGGDSGGLSNLLGTFGKGFNVFSFLPFDSSSRGNTGLPQSTPAQMDYLSKLMQSYITMQVYGDTRVKAGLVIDAHIPESVTTNNPQDDPILTRNYLVSRIARHIGSINEKPRYSEEIEGIFV